MNKVEQNLQNKTIKSIKLGHMISLSIAPTEKPISYVFLCDRKNLSMHMHFVLMTIEKQFTLQSAYKSPLKSI